MSNLNTNNESRELKDLIVPMFLLLLGLLACMALFASGGGGADLISKAAGLPTSAGNGFGRMRTLANELQTPMLFFAFCFLPLGIIAAGLAYWLGGRQAQTWTVRIVAGVLLISIAPGLAS